MWIKKNKKYVAIVGITIILMMIYWLYFRADMSSLISINNDKNIDTFVKKLIQGEVGDKNILAQCEYNVQNLLIFALCKITNNWVYALNIYYLFSFFAISLSSFWMLQKFNCSVWNSIFGSVLLNFLPYHIERGQGQIIDSTFFMVPILIGVIYEQIYCLKKQEKIDRTVFVFFILPWINIKIAYFFVIVYCVIFLCRKDRIILKKFILYELVMSVNCIIVSILNNMHSARKISETLHVASEEGMRILDLLVPIRYHVIGQLLNFRLEYDVSLNATGESGENSMGFLLSFFLVYAFVCLFFYEKTDQRIRWFAWINILVILIANIDGFGYIFEYLGFRVEYWNRLSIFIIVNAVGIMVISLDQIYEWLKNRTLKYISVFLLGLIEILAFMDVFLRHEFYFG